MFQSKEFRRGIEFQLTEALRKQIDRSTPYRNAPKEKADTIITGEVLEWQEATLGRDITNLPRETPERWPFATDGRICGPASCWWSSPGWLPPSSTFVPWGDGL